MQALNMSMQHKNLKFGNFREGGIDNGKNAISRYRKKKIFGC